MKISRREEILNTAIDLFNKNGFSSISIRDISDALKISPGNLTYHFKKKKDIVLELNNKMMNEFLENANFNISNFKELDERIENWCKLQRKYMFVFCDLIVLTQTYPELKELHRFLFDKYNKEIEDLLKRFVAMELLKVEGVESSYKSIANILNILLSLTISINHIIYREEYSTKEIKKLIWSVLIPSFTEKGIKEYQVIKDKVN